MKKIKLNNKIINLYESWQELPLGNFQIMAPLMSKTDMTTVERLLITVESITEPAISRKELESMSFEELSIITEWAKWALDFSDIAGSWEEKDGGFISFEIDGQKYAFDNTFQISVRQMLDLDHLTSERNTDTETHNKWFGKAVDDKELTDRKFWSNIHRIISILIRPAKKRNIFKSWFYKLIIKTALRKAKQTIESSYIDSMIDFEIEKYDQGSVEDRANLFKNKLSAADATMLAFFLSGLKAQYQQTIQDYGLLQEVKQKESLVKNGVGTPQ